MVIRQFKIDKPGDLKAYLQAAETRVDSLSDLELNLLEDELTGRIQALVHPKRATVSVLKWHSRASLLQLPFS